MEYKRMDLSNWNRREHYLHYMKEVVCSYSLTTEAGYHTSERQEAVSRAALAVDICR